MYTMFSQIMQIAQIYFIIIDLLYLQNQRET